MINFSNNNEFITAHGSSSVHHLHQLNYTCVIIICYYRATSSLALDVQIWKALPEYLRMKNNTFLKNHLQQTLLQFLEHEETYTVHVDTLKLK